MKGLVLYRVLTVLVNIFAVFIGITLVFGLMLVISNPGFALGFFMMLGAVLYAWYANKFFKTVIVRQEPFTKKQKDWLQVNAIVALIFGLLLLTQSIAFIRNPDLVKAAFEQMPVKSPTDLIYNTSMILMCFAIAILIHIIWTYVLIRQNKHMIDPEG
jgi:hypothetical protein